MRVEVYVLHSKPKAFHEAQPSTVENAKNQVRGPSNVTQNRPYLGTSQNHRQLAPTPCSNDLQLAQLVFEDVLVKKDERAKRLLLRTGAHPPFICQELQKPVHRRFPQLLRMLSPMEPDVSPYPVTVRLDRPATHPPGLHSPGCFFQERRRPLLSLSSALRILPRSPFEK